ncbi:MAG: twin-arginine translocase TatA/TatE family subunit [Bacillota bacterium]
MFPRIGMPELIIILVVALIIFGPGKLPEAGKALGRTIKEFRRSSRDLMDEAQESIQDAEEVKTADSGKKPEPTKKV